jgi:hypothetical protein
MKKKATQREREKAARLDNSKPLDVHKWSHHKEVNDVVARLYEEIKIHRQKSKTSLLNRAPSKAQNDLNIRHIKVIIIDLWVAYLTDPKMYVAYDRGKGAYGKKHGEKGSRYNELFINEKTIPITDDLIDLKYVEQHKGFFNKDTNTGKLSRMRARMKLIRLIEKTCSPEMIEDAPNRECIILRDEDKNDVEYKDNRKIKSMRSDLYDYNNLIRCTHIDLPDFPEEGVETKDKDTNIFINHRDKFVRRVFNNESWDDGGRFFGGWQQGLPNNDVSGMWREKLRIDNAPTIELDYSALHIILCYALVGIDYWKEVGTDPYDIPEYKHIDGIRPFLKQVMLTILNCKDDTQVCKSIGRELTRVTIDDFGNRIRSKFYWVMKELGWKDTKHDLIRPLLKNLMKPHQKIKKFFHSGKGIKLQNADARVAEIIIREFVMMDTPILCLHDGFIVKRKDFDELLYRMKSAYRIVIDDLKGKSKKVILNPPDIKYDETKPVIYWLGVGNPFTNRKLNKKIFNETMKKPFKDKHYKIRWNRFNQINRDKKYYGK